MHREILFKNRWMRYRPGDRAKIPAGIAHGLLVSGTATLCQPESKPLTESPKPQPQRAVETRPKRRS